MRPFHYRMVNYQKCLIFRLIFDKIAGIRLLTHNHSNDTLMLKRFLFHSLLISCFSLGLFSCREETPVATNIKQMDSVKVATLAASIEAMVKPELAEGLTLKLWGTDSLVISPIGIDVDDEGRLYYTTTNRQKNSEFDIRGHK